MRAFDFIGRPLPYVEFLSSTSTGGGRGCNESTNIHNDTERLWRVPFYTGNRDRGQHAGGYSKFNY